MQQRTIRDNRERALRGKNQRRGPFFHRLFKVSLQHKWAEVDLGRTLWESFFGRGSNGCFAPAAMATGAEDDFAGGEESARGGQMTIGGCYAYDGARIH